MRNILKVLKQVLKDFFINPFWKSWWVLVVIVVSFVINSFLWYFYFLKIKENPIPFIFSSGLIFLNLVLANYLWNREKLASFFLLTVALFTQLLMLIFIKSFLFLNI